MTTPNVSDLDTTERAPRDAVAATYVAILVALGLAGALSTGRLVDAAERLPFGPARERAVTLATAAHALATRAGLHRPSAAVDAARSAAERAEPVVVAEIGDAAERIGNAVSRVLRLAGTGAPTLIARSLGAEMDAEGGMAFGGSRRSNERARAGGDGSTATAEDRDFGPASGASAGDEAGESRDGGASDTIDFAARRRSTLAAAEAAANGDWTPSAVGAEGATGPVRIARELQRIATRVPPPRRLEPTDPLRVHVAGDSMAQPLGYALQRLVVDDPRVVVTLDFRISTGLVRPDYFDWPHQVTLTLDRPASPPGLPPPEVIVFFVGGNENQNMRVGIREVLLVGTPEWAAAYGERAAEIMDIAGRGGARVVWIGLPVMRDPGFHAAAGALNDSVSSTASIRPWVDFVDVWTMFAGPEGGYTAFLPGTQGAPVQLRDEDGIHLSSEGTRLLGDRVFHAIGGVWDVRTPTPTATPTSTPTATSTRTPTNTRTPTLVATATHTAVPRVTPLVSPLVVPEFALPEVAGAVARRTGSSTLGVRAARRVLATPRLTLVEADAATWQLATMLAAAHGLRGADALYVAVARQLGAILVTWDAEMLGRVQRQVAIVSPRAPG